ncbi:MAG: ABC-F family ATP-binding cassette domain-containing protein [Flavobacteriales bacterium]|nr:ABC-F family ATP-binding cassette domain-containing protein [Flavobacteriales bacterium]MBT4930056.1 ABC-F family ATP-binding cassette domain-containing protein [Flavobacteriales bacterium]MBT5132430.1 ABC-F family ATP-binding cassette domain-containing protein [Flavobacteriales bacterium]MBT6132855.1 ABC-F family ATP-binding cassette domain-containing protein [Flavobacteriales bacterium]MBT6916277.1 ABC-F family ATP-binding cassette domain-containing protein [Flavobacteriales bacterium]
MNYLSIDRLSKGFGERTLFENVSFGLAQGDKVAFVANNGTGKSTLLKILAGKDIPDSGEFNFRDGIRVAYLEQEPVLAGSEDQTLEAFVKQASADILEVIRQYEEALDMSSNGSEESLKALERTSAAMDSREAWDFDRRLETMLGRFGIHDLTQRVDTLSGGQRKRLAIALTVLDTPDLLILDEPTNHLDIDMIEWLEQFLMQANITLLMVTHDRYFLDRVCNQILEMHNGKMYRHNGNYAYFLEKRSQREDALQIEIDKAGKLMKKELEWMRRQPKARTTKSKARIDAFDEIKTKANSGKKQGELKLDVKMSRIGGKVLELKKVYKSYDDLEILKGFDYTFKKGERIGVLGKNGVGKSTFLNIITGKEKADSGKVNLGDTIVYGYYTQTGLKLKEDKRVIDVLKDVAEVIQLADGSKLTASQFLQFFLFPPDMQYNFVSQLSGGERRRLHLLTVLIKNPNFLVLDEPTNDLDLLTLNKLEEFLDNFSGCLIIVSHDRYFMDKLVDHLFVFEGEGKVRDFWGPYSEWKAQKEEDEAAEKKNKVAKVEKKRVEQKVQSSSSDKAKLGFKEKYELEQLDKEVPLLEEQVASLQAKLGESSLPYEEIQDASEKLGLLTGELEEKMYRWMVLDERR